MNDNEVKVNSISYIDDAESAEKWFEIYMKLLLEQMKRDKISESEPYICREG
ncbi:hypothetical protein [Lysinibacillus telephonicus]|uniref:hypothetical protein n=1 Tax=Lysinibacillus telephonicus TaxID=1714840 RepID=UPI00163B337C|nr:hypothetical protein [Lysinibacillus telephonicus]